MENKKLSLSYLLLHECYRHLALSVCLHFWCVLAHVCCVGL